MDIPGPLSLPLPIVHCFRQVFGATSRIGTELLYVGLGQSSCFCSSTWRGPQEYITYELVPTSPAVSRMSGSSNLDNFWDGWWVAIQQLLCVVLPPGLVQYCSQHYYIVADKLFLHASMQCINIAVSTRSTKRIKTLIKAWEEAIKYWFLFLSFFFFVFVSEFHNFSLCIKLFHSIFLCMILKEFIQLI